MNWEELLAEFRALGGVADNVVIRQSPQGRGVFPIDPRTQVRLRTPCNLLVRSADTELRAGKLVVKDSASLGQRERIFFERYQENFCWSGGALDELWQAQLAWSVLSKKAQEKLDEIGPTVADRFSEPTADVCYRRYLATRQFNYRGTPVLMPIADLVNHRDHAGQYDTRDGIGVAGTFHDEVGVDYGSDDCWGMAMTHGFCAARRWAHSLSIQFTFEDLDISISRNLGRIDRFNGVPIPIVDVCKDRVAFSFLILGHIQFPRIPRSVFLHLAKTIPVKRPNELFDLIQHHNRMKLVGFLRVVDALSTPLANMLRSAAYQQLETLSAHFGVHSLDKNS